MSFSLLGLIVVVGLLGPLLAVKASWRIPVVVGQLAGGILIGVSGLHLVDPKNDDFRLLADIGFGLTMVVAGSHVPVRRPEFQGVLLKGLLGAAAAGVVAAAVAAGISAVAGTGHALLYAVVLASSSAALVLPMIQQHLQEGAFGQLIGQIAVADAACIVALPLVINPARAGIAALGALAVAAAAVILYLILIRVDRLGLRTRVHELSERRRFALELRISLLALFGLAAIAQVAGLSIMLAGFAFGLVLSAAGEPHRLARQLFGMTEGFFGPLFFVWLGASLNLTALARNPWMIVLGLVLGAGAVVAHLGSRVAGLSWTQSVLASGQLGVPVAAATLGIQTGTLAPGEDAAIILGALVTVAACAVAAARVGRTGLAGRPGAEAQAPHVS